MTAKLRQDLARLLGADAVRDDAQALATYARDWTTQWTPRASAVVFPRSTGQVQQVVEMANRLAFKLVPSGGRTGLSGGAMATQGEVVLSLERMNQLLEFAAVDRNVTVQAGLVTARLQAFAREQGLYYPVDFASAGSSQIGGNIATNAGGIKVIRYGMTREWVRGLTVVTGAGEVLALNRGLLKNNTGYDFRHLFIGSEGSLGVICEATMALTRPPADPVVLVLGVTQFAALLQVLSEFEAALTLSAFECFSEAGLERVVAGQGLSRPFEQRAEFYALIEFEDLGDNLSRALSLFERLSGDGVVSDGVISQSLPEAARLWRLREDLSETLSRWTPYKNDISVAVSRLPAFLDAAQRLVARRYPDFSVVWYGHIGDGNLHLNILKPDDWSTADFVAHCADATEEISALVSEHGGSISAEHGVGLLKRPYLHHSRSAADMELMRQVRRVFDPNGVLNPGKLV